MTRRYRQPIAVVYQEGRDWLTFTWRGRLRLAAITNSWRLSAGWWEGASATDRVYYRVQTAEHAVYDLYHDLTCDVWVLDVCFD